MVSISKLTNSDRKYGLTENGNKYKKCNVAKNIGTGIGAAQTAVMTIAARPGVYPDGSSSTMSNALFCCGLGIVGTLIYRAIGTFVDNSVNKNRMAQADGEAVLKDKMKNGKLVG